MSDLLVLAGYPTSRSLPTIGPYLHAKYPRLDSQTVATTTDLIDRNHESG